MSNCAATAPPLTVGHEPQVFGTGRVNPPQADEPDNSGFRMTGYWPTASAANWCGAHPGRRVNLDWPEREPIAITGSAPKDVRIAIAKHHGGLVGFREAVINWLRKNAN